MAQRRNLPQNVQRAVFQEDRELLSLFGKVSAERRRQRKEQVELLWGTKKLLMLKGAEQMAKEANEHICPVN
jgi:hypothetical protein